MIYRGVKMTGKEGRKKDKRDWLKAVVFSLLGAALIAAMILLSGRLGIR